MILIVDIVGTCAICDIGGLLGIYDIVDIGGSFKCNLFGNFKFLHFKMY